MFTDLNSKFRDLESTQTVTKGLLIAETFLYSLNQSNGHESLKNQLYKYVFRSQRMLLSGSPKYNALVFKQKMLLAKQGNSIQDGQVMEIHPLKVIFRFLFQQVWLNQDDQLGEDFWPS